MTQTFSNDPGIPVTEDEILSITLGYNPKSASVPGKSPEQG